MEFVAAGVEEAAAAAAGRASVPSPGLQGRASAGTDSIPAAAAAPDAGEEVGVVREGWLLRKRCCDHVSCGVAGDACAGGGGSADKGSA